MVSYSNPSSLDFNGDTCDLTNLFISGTERCDNIFIFCLRSQGSSQQDTDSESCGLGPPQITDAFDNSDNINFRDMTTLGNSVSNPIVFSGERWPVRLDIQLCCMQNIVARKE